MLISESGLFSCHSRVTGFLCEIAYRVFSHDVTAAMLVSQNNETAAMLVSQANPVGV